MKRTIANETKFFATKPKSNWKSAGAAKLALIAYVESYLEHEIKETSPKEIKMNIFNINLRRGW